MVMDVFSRINRPAKVTQAIADRVGKMISDGVLLPGQRLPTEKELCNLLGVSRSSVREALQSLEYVGLVRSKPGIGRFLAEDAESLMKSLNYGQLLERASTFELMEARKYLEVVVARLAAERATDGVIADLETIYRSIATSQDMDAFLDWEQEFHKGLARACLNTVLAELALILLGRVLGDAAKFLRTLEYTRERTLDHFGRILAAIRDGDGGVAADIMLEHIEMTIDALNKGAESKAF